MCSIFVLSNTFFELFCVFFVLKFNIRVKKFADKQSFYCTNIMFFCNFLERLLFLRDLIFCSLRNIKSLIISFWDHSRQFKLEHRIEELVEYMFCVLSEVLKTWTTPELIDDWFHCLSVINTKLIWTHLNFASKSPTVNLFDVESNAKLTFMFCFYQLLTYFGWYRDKCS